MVRITIAFEAEQADWIDATADELDRSKAEVVRAGVDALRGEDSPVLAELVNDGEPNTVNHGERNTADRDRLAEAVDELTERVAEVEQRQEPAEPETATGGGRSSGREPHPSTRQNTTPDPATGENTDESELAGLEFPTGRDRAACVAAIRAARSFVDESDGASMREIVANVMPDHPIGYDVPQLEPGDRYRGSWWRKIVKPGLEALDVEKPHGGGEWSIDDTEAGGVYDPTAEF